MVIEDLWFGKIIPCEQFLKEDEAYFDALRKVGQEKERCLKAMSPEISQAFEQIMDMQFHANIIAEKEAFVAGFRLGVQLMVASMGKG